MSDVLPLWVILVPTVRPDGKPFRTRYHRVWDEKIREITKGLTVMPASKGQWVSPQGEVLVERMIPVQIRCTRDQIDRIIDLTLVYYDQKAVMAYKVSDECIIRHRA